MKALIRPYEGFLDHPQLHDVEVRISRKGANRSQIVGAVEGRPRIVVFLLMPRRRWISLREQYAGVRGQRVRSNERDSAFERCRERLVAVLARLQQNALPDFRRVRERSSTRNHRSSHPEMGDADRPTKKPRRVHR